MILCILTILGIIPFDCENHFSWGYVIPLFNLSLYTVMCLVFGIRLLKHIESNYSSTSSEDYIQPDFELLNDKNKQIKFIIITFILTLIS